jgi:hypothetical protein
LPLSIVARPHEAGLIRSWRADSLGLCLARSRNYPMLQKPFWGDERKFSANEDGQPILHSGKTLKGGRPRTTLEQNRF